MASMGNSLDNVKIIKNKDVITIVETYVIQEYSGLGYEATKQAAISVNVNTVVHNRRNLQIAIKNDTITIRSTAGAMHTFEYNLVETEGISKHEDILKFVQALMK